ncbi:4a-hydroxytetrahydrobiopterin dehydratase [Actinoallomurus spadix]|uniref:Putative pterin-4-alpha-carbinolamine dehydratase n=1 Tax=Actinoallomurus spadix TaxID=79912 RepID=A0ABN0WK61_9ACTN|nr:4a-hydroxytetrahydrobiopterin dehydratase [Actinoallomurus spadix]MCO5989741.1 4a-hydroxytetrahydrobiopterin dehydratase [Actinoallomurus spadix]
MERMDADAIDRELATVPGWELAEDAIVKTLTFADFKEAMVFVNRVAEVAEELNHHPDITIRWNRVTLTQSTHVAGGLTEYDFRLARRLNEL